MFGHIFHRNCLIKHLNEGKIEERLGVKVRRGRRLKQLPEKPQIREDTGD